MCALRNILVRQYHNPAGDSSRVGTELFTHSSFLGCGLRAVSVGVGGGGGVGFGCGDGGGGRSSCRLETGPAIADHRQVPAGCLHRGTCAREGACGGERGGGCVDTGAISSGVEETDDKRATRWWWCPPPFVIQSRYRCLAAFSFFAPSRASPPPFVFLCATRNAFCSRRRW